MMDWLSILPLIGYLSYSISNIIDKYTIKKRHLYSITANRMLFDGLWIIIFSLIIGHALSFYILEGVLLGIFYGFSSLLYFKLLEFEEAGNVVSYLMSANILLSFLGAVFILGENVMLTDYIGIVAIIIGVIIIIKDKKIKKHVVKIVFILILEIAMITTAYYLLTKIFLNNADAISLAIIMYMSSALVIALYGVIKKKKVVEKNPAVLGSSFFGGVGTMLIYISLKYMEAATVYPLSGIQILGVMIIAWIVKEERVDVAKLIGALLIMIGIGFVLS